MMSRPTDLSVILGLAVAAALSSCAADEFGEAVSESWDEVRDKQGPVTEAEFVEVRTRCRLPGATLTRHGAIWRLGLPPEIYAARERSPTSVRLACVTSWARHRGVTLSIAEAR